MSLLRARARAIQLIRRRAMCFAGHRASHADQDHAAEHCLGPEVCQEDALVAL